MIPQNTGPSVANIVEVEDFKNQVLWLDENYKLARPDDYLSRSKPSSRPTLLLTFDDGHIDSLSVIASFLEHKGIAGVYFLVSGYLDRRVRPWEERLWIRISAWLNGDEIGFRLLSSCIPRQKFARQPSKAWFKVRRYLLSLPPFDLHLALDDLELTALQGDSVHELMDWGNALSLGRLNHSSIGFHSHSHLNLAEMSAAEIEEDFVLGLEAFATQRIKLAKCVAYPYGKVSIQAANVLNKFGFDIGYVSRWADVSRLPLAKSYPRLFVSPSDDATTLQLRIKRAFSFLQLRNSMSRPRFSDFDLGASIG